PIASSASVAPGKSDASFSALPAPGGTSTSGKGSAIAANPADVTQRGGRGVPGGAFSKPCADLAAASAAIGVSTSPGMIRETVMPLPNNSVRTASLGPGPANLV